eukprot:1143769-Pelagomonas_calceolata.AAC.2
MSALPAPSSLTYAPVALARDPGRHGWPNAQSFAGRHAIHLKQLPEGRNHNTIHGALAYMLCHELVNAVLRNEPMSFKQSMCFLVCCMSSKSDDRLFSLLILGKSRAQGWSLQCNIRAMEQAGISTHSLVSVNTHALLGVDLRRLFVPESCPPVAYMCVYVCANGRMFGVYTSKNVQRNATVLLVDSELSIIRGKPAGLTVCENHCFQKNNITLKLDGLCCMDIACAQRANMHTMPINAHLQALAGVTRILDFYALTYLTESTHPTSNCINTVSSGSADMLKMCCLCLMVVICAHDITENGPHNKLSSPMAALNVSDQVTLQLEHGHCPLAMDIENQGRTGCHFMSLKVLDDTVRRPHMHNFSKHE